MELTLASRFRAAALLLVIGIPGLLLAFKTAEITIAATLGQSFNPPRLRKALALDPSNPELHYRLGMAYCNSLEDYHPTQGIRQLQRAISLNHRQPIFWSGLVSACQSLGDRTCADRATERLLEISPMAPHDYWAAANHYLLEGRVGAAMTKFRRLIALDPGYADQTFRLCLSTNENAQEVYRQVLAGQNSPELNLSFIHFLTAHGRGNAAYPIWKQTVALDRPFPLSRAAPYINWLIHHGADHEALEAWRSLEQRGLVPRPARDAAGNLVYNPGFEHDPLDTGLDWRILKQPYTWVDLDDSSPYAGGRCLRVDFSVSRNGEYQPVMQFVPVTPGGRYLLEAYVRSRGLTSSSGPRLRVTDPACASCLDASTAGTVGTTPWHPVRLSFTAGARTHWVRLSVWRPRARSFPTDITGTFWLDDVTVQSAVPAHNAPAASLHSS